MMVAACRLFIATALAAALIASAAVAEDVRPPSFVDASQIVPHLTIEMRYVGVHNFVGRPIDGYEKPLCLLTREAAIALAAVARDVARRGLGLKVFDCYRPAQAVAHFVRWAKDVADIAAKSEFYPDIDKGDLFKDGYIAERSGHSRGSTVDLTLVRLSDRRELDMGTPFDFFSRRSWPSDRSVRASAVSNRALLARAMTRRGFKPYDKEWWHFTLANEPFSNSYFDFPVQ
jgi:D-alanyl-D-alanine dipeptidase